MSVKMAVFAPIPSASDRIATIANSGLLRSPRTAKRRSFRASVIAGLDVHPAAKVYLRRYLNGEKSVGFMNTDSTLVTIGPSTCDSAATFFHSGSA